MIHMRDVSKIYENGAVALDHVNVDIEAGDFVFIVGASGAGKSTFILSLIISGQTRGCPPICRIPVSC